LNWQSSTDNVNWTGVNPADTSSTYSIINLGSSTQYRVIVKSGVCPSETSAIASVKLLPGLFPKANFEPADTTICYGATAALHAVISLGTNYTWTNSGTLAGTGDGNIRSIPFSINASATPLTTTDYILRIINAGCPNPLLDTFHVGVIPPVLVNAGNDTSVVINQPLQLHAIANDTAITFSWTPATGLNNPDIPDPVAILNGAIDSIRYVVKAISTSPAACFGTANILVKVFKTAPDIFVPGAFTPGKSSNSIFRPIPVGISSLQYFRIYNRWGQLVYSTSAIGKGWDGTVNGRYQDAGGYVWMVQGTTYSGKTVFHKGTMILIR
jgi:gliding motility-associated-like protein